jgi:hypothetical protein
MDNKSNQSSSSSTKFPYNILLPNFFIVGANKAGTTSLHYYCSQHPEIFMAKAKEPMFFTALQSSTAQNNVNKTKDPVIYQGYYTLQDYLKLFETATEPIRGESSTSYLANRNAAVWISKISPASKIIAILRNPIERAISDFKFQIKVNQTEKRTLSQAMNDALNNKIDPSHQNLVLGNLSKTPGRYVNLGLYSSQIELYKRCFPENQLFIADYDEYNNDTVKFVKKVYNFLEVSDFTPKTNRLNTSEKSKPEFEKDLINNMKDYFRNDIKKLQSLVSFDVMKWLD